MTNLFNSSKRPKLLFIHGLNNNRECWDLIIKHFENLGFETERIILPGHGDDREEARDLKTALRVFDQSMKKMQDTPYFAIAFSHGALYLQLWLEKNLPHRPLKQVLIAPALYIHKQSFIKRAIKLLPSFLIIKSISPKTFRRYHALKVWEYRILVDGLMMFQKLKHDWKVPTKVFIDPKDELVNAKLLREKFGESVEFYEREYLQKGHGAHHILFHPDYFHEADWKNFTRKIEGFLK